MGRGRSGRYAPVPLRHTAVEIDVRGLVASATVTQEYRNEGDEPLQAVYVFPLPPDAAVYDMEIRVGDRVIRSLIQEKEEARRTYDTARAEGRRAALVEQERPNVFTASVANLMPGDRIGVRIRYVEALATRPGHDLSLRVALDPGTPLAELASPTHPVTVSAGPDGRHEVRLLSETTLPNRDFVLEYRSADLDWAETALFLSRDDETGAAHALLVALPPTRDDGRRRVAVEMLFVVDVSGSMAGTSIEQARAALLQAIDRLRPGDRFNIVPFSSDFESFAPAPVEVADGSLASARRFVRGLAANGGTEMLPALEHTMAMPASDGLVRQIVLITDGCLGNEDAIFSALEHRLRGARLFTVAIGSAPNHPHGRVRTRRAHAHRRWLRSRRAHGPAPRHHGTARALGHRHPRYRRGADRRPSLAHSRPVPRPSPGGVRPSAPGHAWHAAPSRWTPGAAPTKARSATASAPRS